MIHQEIRKRFLEFFEKRGHKIVPSSSLIPDDPSVLFTTAGMQQFKKYYLEAESPYGNRIASIQKCLRTSDIDQVGDESHLTFFEMLGNFSFKFPEAEDSYFKEEAIKSGYDFIINELGVPLERIKISVFKGDDKNKLPADSESLAIWRTLGISDDKIFFGDRNDNFWGPTGLEGPCGPTTEIHIDPSTHSTNAPLHEGRDSREQGGEQSRTTGSGQAVEVWNIVFNEYYCDKDKSFTKLEKLGVDTGMGLERLAVILQKKKNVFETDLFEPIIGLLPQNLEIRKRRIIADHARAIVFLVSDGIRPSNKEKGYVLRRLMRRIIAYAYQENIKAPVETILKTVVELYSKIYPNLDFSIIKEVYEAEYQKFIKSVGAGFKELERLGLVNAKAAFRLYESFGLPYEIIKESAGLKAKELTREGFDQEFKRHQTVSRAGAEGKFKS